MNEPRRLIEAESDDFEREVLRSAKRDQASERALRRTLVSIGVGLAVTPAAVASAVPASVTLGSKLGTVVLAKWLFTGVALGVVTAGGVGLSERVLAPAPAAAGRLPAKAAAMSSSAATDVHRFTSDAGTELAEPALAVVSEPLPAPARPSAQRSSAVPPVAAAPEPSAAVDEPAPLSSPITAPVGGAVEQLAKETGLLDTARGALLRGDAVRALATLAEYEQSFARGMLAPEARVLRVRALLAGGQRQAAEEVAGRIVDAAPSSEHARTVRALLGAASNP